MSDNRQELTGQESLSIISSMIAAARQEQKDDGMGWIIWGWMLFVASTLTLVNMYLKWVEVFFFWNFFGLATLVLLVFLNLRRWKKHRSHRVKTYTQEVFGKLNIGFSITLITTIIAMNVGIRPIVGFSLLLALYGFWILIYGALFNFKPSEIASYIVFALALAGLFVSSFIYTMVLHSVAVVIGYIIPGYMANSEFKKAAGRQSIKKEVGV